MNRSDFQKCIMLFSLALIMSSQLLSQGFSYRSMTRGADTGELYINCKWYITPEFVIRNGLFRSDDHGRSLTLQRDANWVEESGALFGDPVSGALFQAPFHFPDSIGVSFDYGFTFETRYHQDIYNTAAGSEAGILFVQSSGLYLGADYANNFTLQMPDTYALQLHDTGILPGELFCLGSPVNNPLHLGYSCDYGQNFTYTDVVLPGITCDFAQIDIHRGAVPGELYFIVWKCPDTVVLFHSPDYGQQVTQQHILTDMSYYLYYTAGRSPGSFYFARLNECCFTPNTYPGLWIDASFDHGVNFTTYYHDLTLLATRVTQHPSGSFHAILNPSGEVLTLGYNLFLTGAEASLVSLTGRTLFRIRLPDGKGPATLPVGPVPKGMYILLITSQNKPLITEKVIIR